MVQKMEVEGFDAFVGAVESVQSGKPIFVLFSGSKNPNGVSWCPDCVTAEPVVKGAVDKSAPEDSVFIYVGVGGRDFWKDPNCIFRTDSRTKLKSVPTLMKYGAPQRLEEEQCAKANLVEMLFEDA